VTRIIDYAPSDEQSLVSRILLTVHKAADEAFPVGKGMQRQYAKTVVAGGNAANKTPEAPPAPRPVPSAQNSAMPSKMSSQVRLLSGTHDDSEIDYLLGEKQKSRKLLFFAIVMATAAFVALTLLISSRNFR
jgi:hypothetical protein